ncbi:MAG: hypothetical protein ACYSSM_04725 [Planctomycetota bacterium]|jgi:hypothetical protein
MESDPKNGGFNILNPKITNIDFTAYDKIKVVDGEYRCICRNRSVHIGFYKCDEKGRQLEAGMNDSTLLCCGFCGRIFDENTLEIIRGVYIR